MARRKSSPVQRPIPVSGSGVMLVEWIVPNGVDNGSPPAKGSPPGLVWQERQLPMAVSSAPLATRAASNEARSGASAAPATRGRSIDLANARTPSSIEPARIILRFILRPRTAAAAKKQTTVLRTYADRAAFPAADKWPTAPLTSARRLRARPGRIGAVHRPAPIFVAGPVEGGELGLDRDAGPACRTHDLEPDAVRGELVRRRHEGMRALVKEDEVVHLRRQRLELRFVPDDAVSRTSGFGDGDAPAHDDRMIGRRSNFGNRPAAGGAPRRRAVGKGERGRVAHRDQRCCAEQQQATSPAAWRRDGKKH